MKVWKPPAPGEFKVNCDASVSANGLFVGFGCVCRDSQGGFIAAMGDRLASRISPLTAELNAILHSLEWANQFSWERCIIETDCQEAVCMISAGEECLASDGVIVESIKRVLAGSRVHSVIFAPREANRAAHEIACFVARGDGRCDWFGIGPPWLMSVISNDSPVTSRDARGEGRASSPLSEVPLLM